MSCKVEFSIPAVAVAVVGREAVVGGMAVAAVGREDKVLVAPLSTS